ncbi:MAG: hypothetical protein LUH18_03690 [Oscillospiraceae bacterium]|nr:hypothetical protein [Oscillospiraceae bacterium]
MINEICCPNCGNRELQVQTETRVGGTRQTGVVSSTSTTYWCCSKCGRRFISPEDMRKKIAGLEKAFVALTVTFAIFAFLVFLILLAVTSGGGAMAFIASFLAAFIFIFGLLELFTYPFTKHAAKRKKKELQQLEEDMARFLQK